MYRTVKTAQDAKEFYDISNAMHDGYLVASEYRHGGIEEMQGGGLDLRTQDSVLVLRIKVTSLKDRPVFELVFGGLKEWVLRYREHFDEILDTTLLVRENGDIFWSDGCESDGDGFASASRVLASSLLWRIL